jgi:hypothetical protein
MRRPVGGAMGAVQIAPAATDPKLRRVELGCVDGPIEGRDPMASVNWLEKPAAHDFPSAADYLDLVADPQTVKKLTKRLKSGKVSHKKAKDILRAARLALLPVDNPHVSADLAKIQKGQPLSPILLVRGDFTNGAPLQVADGFHRVCASYHTDENTDIPVVIAEAGGKH